VHLICEHFLVFPHDQLIPGYGLTVGRWNDLQTWLGKCANSQVESFWSNLPVLLLLLLSNRWH
jgi:hypothetical protein